MRLASNIGRVVGGVGGGSGMDVARSANGRVKVGLFDYGAGQSFYKASC